MQYALVENERTPPSAGLTGACPLCGDPMVAKCGTQRVHHWAHRGQRVCDAWWEPETEWHRSWKEPFPKAWREVIGHDEHGEKHIADVRTDHGLVLEFQYSHLDPVERAARERFHGNMVWIVNGSRLKRDYPRFQKNRSDLRPTVQKGFFLLYWPEECFPADWLNATVPVIFDFKNDVPDEPVDQNREPLWCLLPGRAEGQAVVVALRREQLISIALASAEILPAREVVEMLSQIIRGERARSQMPARRRSYHLTSGFSSRVAPIGRKRRARF